MPRPLTSLSSAQIRDLELSTEDIPLIDRESRMTTVAGDIYLNDVALTSERS